MSRLACLLSALWVSSACGGGDSSPGDDASPNPTVDAQPPGIDAACGPGCADAAPPACGDGTCTAGVMGEDCATCSADCGVCPMGCPSGNCITLDSQTTYQTMRGWEVVGWMDNAAPGFASFAPLVLDQVVDLGINRVRLEVRSGVEHPMDNYQRLLSGQITHDEWRCLRYATVNDNADPNTIDPAGFHFTELDERIDELILPLRQRVEARGESLFVLLTYVSFTAQIGGCGAFIHDDQPEEYGELMLAVHQHMESRYGFVPDAVEAVLEPDNATEWDATELGQAVAAAGTRLAAAGYTPSFVVPGAMCMSNAVPWIDDMAAVPGALDYLSEVSYHRYCGASLANLHGVRDKAAEHGVFPSMLEWWEPGNGHDVLHEDLVEGDSTAWEISVLGDINAGPDSIAATDIDNSDPGDPVVTLTDKAKLLSQYFRRVRAGATRIAATSTAPSLRPVAFINPGGGWTVVVNATAPDTFDVANLPAGTYAVDYTTSTDHAVPAPDVTLAAGDQLSATIPAPGVLTIHAR